MLTTAFSICSTIWENEVGTMVPVCLEITSQHAKKSGEKYGGRKNTKHRHGIAAHQDSRAKEGKQTGQAAHDYHIAYGTAENFLGVPVFPQRQPLGNHLGKWPKGYCRRIQGV